MIDVKARLQNVVADNFPADSRDYSHFIDGVVDALGIEWNGQLREVAPGGERVAVLVWSCNACGPALDSRANWCDLGCGSDYNRMTFVPLFRVPALETAGYVTEGR